MSVNMLKSFALEILQQELVSSNAVHGGDINSCFRLETDDAVYFLKLNDGGKFPGMFKNEADGLHALKEIGRMNVPDVLRQGGWQQQQFLLLQWIDSAAVKKDFWQSFGHALADMHRQSAESFGWKEDNYIGSLVQKNAMHKDWHSFFVQCRIMPMVQRLADSNKISQQEYQQAMNFCDSITKIFPEEPPALLHGDLWSGNFMSGSDGHAIIYDPAVYYGHREMDIGMTGLFGGFPAEFYTAYQQGYPLTNDWQQRLPIAQLYPVLVHAVLFGGHYIARAKQIMQQYL